MYYSKSKKQWLNEREMHTAHLLNAYRASILEDTCMEDSLRAEILRRMDTPIPAPLIGTPCIVDKKSEGRFIGLHVDDFEQTHAVISNPGNGLYLTLVHPSRVGIVSN